MKKLTGSNTESVSQALANGGANFKHLLLGVIWEAEV